MRAGQATLPCRLLSESEFTREGTYALGKADFAKLLAARAQENSLDVSMEIENVINGHWWLQEITDSGNMDTVRLHLNNLASSRKKPAPLSPNLIAMFS